MKKLLALLLCFVMSMALVACDSNKDNGTTTTTKPTTAAPTTEAKAQLPESVVEVKKPDAGVITFAAFSFKVNDKAITNDTLKDYQIYKITCKSTNKSGETSEDTYGGYLLTDVLKAAGVTDYKTVTVTANDGYAVDFDKAEINEYTIVGIEKNKELGDDGTIWVAPCDQSTAQKYCKYVVSIEAK